MHITLTGNLGSGKSTICKILEEKYGFEIYSTGKVQRSLASELGISVLEMNQLMCTDHKYDKMIDDATARISKENMDKNIVFDSRLAWNFVECSFKVFLSVELDVAARRVYYDNRGSVEKYQSIEDAVNNLRLRAKTEDIRYKEIYQVDYFNFNNYDLVLDSTYCLPELLAKVMIQEANNYFVNGEKKILLSPRTLGFPIKDDFSTTIFYKDNTVMIRKVEQSYEVIEGGDIVEKAAREGIPFVRVEIV